MESSKECGVTVCMTLIGSNWKPIILFKISKGFNRFNRLITEVNGINRQMLSKQLKQLEKSGVLERTSFGEIPPRVEYKLTPLGKSLMPVVQSMNKWGLKHQEVDKKVIKSKKADSQQLPLFG